MADRASQLYRKRLVLGPGATDSVAASPGMDVVVVAVHLSSAAALDVDLTDSAGSMLPLVAAAGVPCTLPQFDGGWARGGLSSAVTIANNGTGTAKGAVAYRYLPHETEL